MARKPTKDLSFVNWNTQSALELNRIHRAIGIRYPLTTTFRGLKIHLIDISVPQYPPLLNSSSSSTGSFIVQESQDSKKKLFIKAKKGWLECSKLKFSGKRPIEIKDFVNGYLPDSSRDCFGS
jgi:methionyl-tRNA formyltransferase